MQVGTGSCQVLGLEALPEAVPTDYFQQELLKARDIAFYSRLADHRRDNTEALATLLAIDGLETRFALNGVDAIESLGLWQPHVFVLDISMPEHDGFAVARVLRSMPATCGAGIIAFTASAKTEFLATGPVVDFDGYRQKRGSHTPLLKMINGCSHGRSSPELRLMD